MAEAEVKPAALEGVLKRLDEFVKPFAASLKHDAQRQHAAEYVAGLVSNVKRKNIETIAYLHEQDRQPMQKFIGQRPWDEGPMIDELVRQVAASIGRADGVLVIDPSGVLKQGKASVGVARQGAGERERWTTARSASIWPTSLATNRHWSMRGCTCPKNGRKTNDVAGKREYPGRSSFAHG